MIRPRCVVWLALVAGMAAMPAKAAGDVSACQRIEMPESARAACSAIIDRAPKVRASAWAYNNRGLAQMARGAYLAAIADFSRAIELDADSAAAWSNRGTAHARLGDMVPALADHERALALEPDAARHWHNRAVDREEMGAYRAALDDYRKALSLDPGHRGSHIGLATAACKLARVEASATARLAAIEKGHIDVIEMQTLLQAEGFYRGAIDGQFGKGSRAALRAWTRKGCLAPS